MTADKKIVLKLIGWSIAIHIILILSTVLEVFIYSTFINPGQDVSHYESHAQDSGPYIGIILGFIVIAIIAIRMLNRNQGHRALIAYGLPIAYIIVDLIILILSGIFFGDHPTVFAISYLTKMAAGQIALWQTRTNKISENHLTQ